MAFPPSELRIASFTWGPHAAAFRSLSPFSFVSNSYDFMGDTWTAQISLAHNSGRSSNVLLAWIASLKGPSGAFELLVFDYAGPASISANPTVASAASARAEILPVDMVGGDAFAVGEFLTVDGSLYIVTAAPAPVGGVQRLTVWPRLRSDYADGDPIEALAPYATWSLADPENAYARATDGRRTQSLKLVEVV